MRDPLDPKTKPFEALGVSMNAVRTEINKAYASAMKEARTPATRVELTQAWHRIRQPERRLEDDIWCYEQPRPEPRSQQPRPAPAEALPLRVDILPGCLCREDSDLDSGQHGALMRAISKPEADFSLDPERIPTMEAAALLRFDE